MSELLIERRDLRSFEVRESVRPQIAPGQAALAVERFGLTSNNLTYALSGAAMGYWDGFPAEGGWGRMPVWGFAEVLESSLPELAEGTRLFGMLPPSGYVVLEPGPPAPWGFEERSPHRAGLPQVYNTYLRVTGDPLYAPESEDLLALLRMLYVTAFLLADSVHELTLGAPAEATVVISSASSKTALALAHELRQRGNAAVVGLTSPANASFVRRVGVYERVIDYEDIASLDTGNAFYIDFAGNEAVRREVHERLGPRLLRSVVVGIAHWDRTGADRIRRANGGGEGEEAFAFEPGRLAGPTPELFFAGDPIDRHVADLGVDGLWAMLAEPWRQFLAWSAGWLTVEHARGSAGLATAYGTLLEGELDPSLGIVVTP